MDGPRPGVSACSGPPPLSPQALPSTLPPLLPCRSLIDLNSPIVSRELSSTAQHRRSLAAGSPRPTSREPSSTSLPHYPDNLLTRGREGNTMFAAIHHLDERSSLAGGGSIRSSLGGGSVTAGSRRSSALNLTRASLTGGHIPSREPSVTTRAAGATFPYPGSTGWVGAGSMSASQPPLDLDDFAVVVAVNQRPRLVVKMMIGVRNRRLRHRVQQQPVGILRHKPFGLVITL